MSTPDLRALLRTKGLNLGKLADAVGVDKATVTRWAQRRVPAERVIGIEKTTGISRSDLRPDLYPPPDSPAGGR